MGLKITYEHPDYPKGYEFAFTGLGIIENGGSLVISDAQAKELPSDYFAGEMFKTEKAADPKGEVGVAPEPEVAATNEEGG